MKRTQLLVVSVLALGLQSIAQASPFPADGEASYNLAPASSYAEKHAGGAWAGIQSAFPADGEASYSLPTSASYAQKRAGQPGSAREMRSQSAFPSGFANLDG